MVLEIPWTAKVSAPYDSYSTARYPLGMRLTAPDGREWVFGLNGAVLAAAGSVYQALVPVAAYDDLVVTATAAAATTVNVTTGATAFTLNQFTGGYLIPQDDAGEGYVYGVKDHAAIGTTTAGDINLTSGLEVAFTSATTVLMLEHPMSKVIIHPSPATGLLVGVAASAIAASEYGWFQTRGIGSVLTVGTVVINEAVTDSLTVDGGVDAHLLVEGTPNTGGGQRIVGHVAEVAATGEYSAIDLRL